MNTPKIRNKKFKNKIEEFFQMSFSEFVSKNFKMGMTRVECCNLIGQLSNGKVSPKTSTVWNYVKQGIKNGEITDFDFCGRKSKGNKKSKSIKVPKTIIVAHKNQKTVITFTCQCGNTHTEKIDFTSDNSSLNIKLRVHKCPSCGQRASCSAEFVYNDILIRKAIVDEDNILCECFVDENKNIILNPTIQYDILNEESVEENAV